MSLHHALSRLLSGDLPPDEAASLRHRIAHEPAVAAAWDAVQRAARGVEDLPDMPPPAGLDALVLASAARHDRWTRWSVASVVAVAIAASVFLWVARPLATPATVVAVAGQQVVDGELLLLAGDVTVEVDGQVCVSVEPPPGGERAIPPHPQEGTMNRTTVLAALSGSVVTIAVYEGSAVVRAGDDAPPLTLRAGEQHVVPGKPARQGPDPDRDVASTSAPSASSQAQTIRTLRTELADVKAELAELQVENAFNRGQLEAHQGRPALWPDTVAEKYTEAFLHEQITDRLVDVPNISLDRMDCTEYPCLVVVRSMSDADAWDEEIEAAFRGLSQDQYADDASVNVNNSEFNHNGYVERYAIMAVSAESDTTEAVSARLDYRMDDLVDTLGAEVRERGDASAATQP